MLTGDRCAIVRGNIRNREKKTDFTIALETDGWKEGQSFLKDTGVPIYKRCMSRVICQLAKLLQIQLEG